MGLAVTGDAAGEIAATLGRLLRGQAADVAKTGGGLRSRSAIRGAARLADENLPGTAVLVVPERVALGGDIQPGHIAGEAAEARSGQLIGVVAGVDVADHQFEGLGAEIMAPASIGIVPDRQRQAERGVVIVRTADGEGRGSLTPAGEITQPLVHHLRYRVAPHPALSLGERTVGDPAAILVVVVAAAGKTDGAQPVDGFDDSHHCGELAGGQVDLVGERRNLLAQHPPGGVLGVGAGQQAEHHPVFLAILLEQAGRLERAGRVLLAVRLHQPGLADLDADRVIADARGRDVAFPVQMVVVPAALFFVVENDVVVAGGKEHRPEMVLAAAGPVPAVPGGDQGIVDPELQGVVPVDGELVAAGCRHGQFAGKFGQIVIVTAEGIAGSVDLADRLAAQGGTVGEDPVAQRGISGGVVGMQQSVEPDGAPGLLGQVLQGARGNELPYQTAGGGAIGSAAAVQTLVAGHRPLDGEPFPDPVLTVVEHPQQGRSRAERSARLAQSGVGEQVAGAGRGKIERCVFPDVVTVFGDTGVLLAPAVRVLGDVGPLENGLGGAVHHPVPAVEHLAQGVNARGAQVVEEIPAPLVGAFLVGSGGGGGKAAVAGIIGVALVRIEVPEVVDQDGFIPHIQDAVAVEVRSVVVGLVVKLVVAAHHQQVQRRRVL